MPGIASTANELRIQISGHGLQIGSERLDELLNQSPGLQQHLLMFVQSLLIQATQTVLEQKCQPGTASRPLAFRVSRPGRGGTG